MAELAASNFIQAPPEKLSSNLGSLDRQLQIRFSAYSETPQLDSKVLLAHILNQPKTWVIAHPEYHLSNQEHSHLTASVERLDLGEPLPYILGAWEFYGLRLKVTPAVLIPRPETELLVEKALAWLHSHPERRVAADVGTGSGCIAAALATSLPDLHVVASDISSAALACAQENFARHKISDQVNLMKADLLTAVDTRFDLICANLPYIPQTTLKTLPVAQREPTLALDGGPDGLELVRRLLEDGKNNLRPKGCMLLEIEASQGQDALKAGRRNYPEAVVDLCQDLAGHDRLLAIQT